MSELVGAYGWCILQVTLLSLVACAVYLAARRVTAVGNVFLLTLSLVAVGVLTLLSVSPWPRWNWQPPLPLRLALDNGAGVASMADVELLPSTAGPSGRDGAAGETPDTQPSTASLDISATGPIPAVVAPDSAGRATGWPWPAWLVLVAWLLGTVGLVRLAVGLAYLRRCRRESVPVHDAALADTVDQLSGRFSAARRVDVREAPAIDVPATVGWRRPAILLPSTWREWSAVELRAVLAHELAHVEDSHVRAWLAGQLALAVHLYHPLVHWLTRRLRLELELAADRLAASAFDDRQQYATALAAVALGGQPGRAFAGVGLFMTRPLLMRRIAMLRQPNRRSVRKSRPLRALALLLVAGTTLAVAGLRGQSIATAADGQSPSADAATNRIAELPDAAAPTARTASAGPYVVTAMFQVSRQPPSLLGADRQPISDAAWATFCNTQVALLKSDFVLQAALRDPKIASLPMIRSEDDPVKWLRSHLEVGFRPGSEILAVQMHGNQDDVAQLKQLVDAVVKAYQDDVVYTQRLRVLNTRDALAKAHDRLNDELARKRDESHRIAMAIGSAEHGGVGQIEQQLALKRLDRVETELMRLENEQLAAQLQAEQATEPTPEMKTNLKFYARRVEQLRGRQEELEKKVKASSETSVDLQVRTHEVEQLQRLVDDMTMRLEAMDIEMRGAPDRIRLLQPAMASRTD